MIISIYETLSSYSQYAFSSYYPIAYLFFYNVRLSFSHIFDIFFLDYTIFTFGTNHLMLSFHSHSNNSINYSLSFSFCYSNSSSFYNLLDENNNLKSSLSYYCSTLLKLLMKKFYAHFPSSIVFIDVCVDLKSFFYINTLFENSPTFF